VFSGETIRSKKDYESTFKSSIGLDDADLEMQLRLGFEKYKKSKSHDYHRLQSKPFSNHRDALIKFFKHGRDKFINKQGKKL